MKRIEFFDGAETSVEPVIGDVPLSALKSYQNTVAYLIENTLVEGSIYIENGVVRYYDGEDWQDVATILDLTSHTNATAAHGTDGDIVGATDAQTLTNKTIDANENNIIIDAEDVNFDNSTTGMSPTDVQGAIVDNRAYAEDIDSSLTDHISGNTPHAQILNVERLAVGTVSPSASARVQFDSTTQGSIPWPRMTTTQRDAISSPSAGLVIFNNETNQPEVWNGSVWGAIAGGGGSGGINHIDNESATFEGGTVGDWVVKVNSSAGDVPTPAATGTPNVNVTFTVTDSDPLRGGWSGVFTKDAANRQGHFAELDFTIDNNDRNAINWLSFDFEGSANYSTDDVKPFIWDTTNGAIIPLGRSGSSKRFTASIKSFSDSTNYKLILHIASTNASAWTLKVDNFVVGPTPLLDMSVEKQTTLGTSGDLTSGSLEVIRNGNIVVLTGSFGHASSSSASSVAGYLPEWAQPDSTHMNVYQHDSVAIRRVEVKSDGQISFVYRDYAGSGLTSTGTSALTISYNVPPLNPTALLTTTELMNESAYVSVYRTGNQSAINNEVTDIVFNTVVEDKNGLYDSSTGTFTAKEAGKYLFTSRASVTDLSSGTGELSLRIRTSGGSLIRGGKREGINNGGQSTVVSTVVPMSAGDTARIAVFQNNGATRNIAGGSSETYLEVVKLPDLTVYGALNNGEFPQMLEVLNGYTQRSVDYANDDYVPIVASGSNSDGEWVRYADGTLIQVGISRTSNIDTASGNIFEKSPITLDFPVEFSGGLISGAISGTEAENFWGVFRGLSNSQVRLGLFAAASLTNRPYNFMAIGRWRA